METALTTNIAIIKNSIYYLRNKQVMLDSDIAELFNVETGNLNKAMTRNINRFPDDFCFQLTNDETSILLWSQNATSRFVSSKRRYNPYVYNEQGIITLAGVLKSEVSDQMCVRISRVFVKMRHALIEYPASLKLMTNA